MRLGSLVSANRKPQNGLEHVDTILQDSFGDFIVSKQKLRQYEGIFLVRQKRETQSQNLAYAARPFILCGLPVRRPPKEQLLFERRNGHFKLQITGHPEFGLPFGQDRLVLIFLATMAVQQRSQVVRFRAAAEMLDFFGMSKGGKEYRRIVAAFERIFGATIFFSTQTHGSAATVIHRSRFNFLREAEIWYGRPAETTHRTNTITLSDEFYSEVIGHPIPSDLEAIKVLAAAPALLDLFMWLSYRCFVSKGPESIPLFGPSGLTQQLGCMEYSRPSRFRAMLEQWLRTIRSLWPECPAVVAGCGKALLINRRTAIVLVGTRPAAAAS